MTQHFLLSTKPLIVVGHLQIAFFCEGKQVVVKYSGISTCRLFN